MNVCGYTVQAGRQPGSDEGGRDGGGPCERANSEAIPGLTYEGREGAARVIPPQLILPVEKVVVVQPAHVVARPPLQPGAYTRPLFGSR